MAMTLEQQRALALARARQRAAGVGPGNNAATFDNVQQAAEAMNLPIPGSEPTRGYHNELPPDYRSPIDMVSTFGNELAGSVPIAGPTLRNMGENFDAWVDTNVYRPLTGNPGTTTHEDVAAVNAEKARQNPEAATAGRIAGPVGSYLLASRIPGANRALGFEGPLRQRLMFGIGSQQAINTADNMAHGQNPQEAFMNALLPTAIAAPFSVFGRNPNAQVPARQASVDVMAQEGVPLTAGQATGNKTLQYAESELGGGAAERFLEEQGEAFTRAALSRVGVDAARATPEVMEDAYKVIGQQFDNLAARNGLQTDAQFVADLNQAWRKFDDATNANTRPPIVQRTLDGIADRMGTGYTFLPGEWYSSTRSELARTQRDTSNPEVKKALGRIIGALDGAMERSIMQVNPADVGAFQQARAQYRDFLVIEDAVSRAGEKAVSGIITPANLRSAVASNQGKRGYTQGRGNLNEMSRAGVETMSPLPQSGTAPRTAVRNLFVGGPSTIAGTLAGHQATGGSLMGTLAGMVGGAVMGSGIPYAVGRGLLSPAGREMLSSQGGKGEIFKRFLANPQTQGIARALITGGAG